MSFTHGALTARAELGLEGGVMCFSPALLAIAPAYSSSAGRDKRYSLQKDFATAVM